VDDAGTFQYICPATGKKGNNHHLRDAYCWEFNTQTAEVRMMKLRDISSEWQAVEDIRTPNYTTGNIHMTWKKVTDKH
jgi:hypothetical protein